MSKTKEKKSIGPSLEDTVKRLETRLREFEDRSGKKIKDLEDLVFYLTNKLTNLHGSSREEKEDNQGKLGRLEETVSDFDEKLEVTKCLLERIEEKLYDFDVNKKNNLIFNGITRQNGEDAVKLTGAVQDII